MARPDDAPARRWLFDAAHPAPPALSAALDDRYLADEAATLSALLERAALSPEQAARVRAEARALVDAIRRRQQDASGVDALLREYDLSSGEGIVLMCLAEALLRIPDADTADRLIADKLGSADWQAHVGASDSLFVNASTWALLLTGRIVRPADVAEPPASFFVAARRAASASRSSARRCAKRCGSWASSSSWARRSRARCAARRERPELNYSFDMLGEAALTAADAERYFAAYAAAIAAVGRSSRSAAARCSMRRASP